MKRIISILLVAILCLGVLTGCQVLDKVTGTIGGWFGQGQANEDTGLAAADVYLHNLYSKKDGSSVTTDFDVVGRVPGGDGKFLNVTWTCDDASIVIRESTTQGFYTVDLPAVNNEEFTFTLTATITDEKGETKVRSYTFKMLKVDNSVVVTEPTEGVAYKLMLSQNNLGKRIYALNTQQLGKGDGASKGKYIKTTTVPKDGAEFFVEKVDGGYKFYTEVNGVKNYIVAEYFPESEGSNPSKYIGFSTETGSVLSYNNDLGGVWTVTIEGNIFGIGTYNTYNTICISESKHFSASSIGSSQFVVQVVTAEYANAQEEDKDLPTYNNSKEIVDMLYALADGETQNAKFNITGTITELDSYGNPTIVVEGYEDKPVYCFKLTDDKFVVGATITVEALIIKNYKGTYELDQCTLKSFTAPGAQPPVSGDSLGIVDAPAVGTAYKFGFDKSGTNLFFTGKTSSASTPWYFATSDNTAEAVDVYLETVEGVEGAYRLFFYDGDAKTYVVAYPRDGDTTKGTLKLDTAVPETYFTFNSEYNTLIYTSTTGEQFYLGTYGTYKTVSCSAISNITNADTSISHLYAEGATGSEGGNNGGNGGNTGNEGGNTKPVEGAPVAGQAYDLYMVLPSGTVYFSGALDAEKGTYLTTTNDAAASVKIYFEVVSGGYNIYFMNGDTKTYINAEAYLKSNGYAGCHFTLGTTATTVWTYDATYGILEVYGEVDGQSDTFFAGTYGSYNTVSLSGAYYKDQIASGSQYPAKISLAGGEVTPPAGGDNGGNEGGNEGGNTGSTDVNTIAGALNAASGTVVTFTGTVVDMYESWSSYNNCSPYVADENGNKILVFRTTTKVHVGDVITVTGTITVYNEVNQIAQGSSTVTIVTAHTCSYSDATCTEPSLCTSCGAQNAPALGHTAANANGCCDRCGQDLSIALVEKDLSFADVANRTTFTTSQQVWEQNGVKLINDKSASTSNVGDYYNPARFYKSSKLTIEYTKMTKIEFVCNNASYATALQSSIASNNNYTVTVSGTTVTVTFVNAVDSFVVESLTGGQVRVNSLTVTAVG